jgi:dTDP-4-dehydrorhamnose 3,5-epimerase
MRFTSTPLPGCYLIDLEKCGDERGFFARVFCTKEFQQMGLVPSFVQVNNSLSVKRGTLRGMHYQLPPAAETKVIRCLRGSLQDVILDLRPHSPACGQHWSVTLTAENRTCIYVPKGFANGFLTLEENTEVIYLVSASYAPELERIVRYNDPRFGIRWLLDPAVVSAKDAGQPDFDPAWHLNDAMRELP